MKQIEEKLTSSGFAEAATKIEAARLLTYNAARLKEEGKVCYSLPSTGSPRTC